MAFQPLTEEQTALLSEEQKALYLKELSIHEERLAFVEKLEALEQVELTDFHPALNPIKTADPAEIPKTKFGEFSVAVPKTVVPSGDIRLPKLNREELVINELPTVTVSAAAVPELEFDTIQPVVPKIDVPAVEAYNYQPPVLDQVPIPEPLHVQVNVPKIGSFETVDPNVPTVPTAVLPDLPAPIDGTQLAANVAAELPAIEIPTMAASHTMIEQPESVNVPKVNVVSAVKVGEIQIPMPGDLQVQKVSVDAPPAVPSFEALAFTVTSAPKVEVDLMPELPTFSAPTFAVSRAPEVAAAPAEASAVHVEKPVLSELPRIPDVVPPVIHAAPVIDAKGIANVPEVKLPDLSEIEAVFQAKRVMPKPEVTVSAPAMPSVPVMKFAYSAPAAVYVPKVHTVPPKDIEIKKAEVVKRINAGGVHEE